MISLILQFIESNIPKYDFSNITIQIWTRNATLGAGAGTNLKSSVYFETQSY